MNLKVTDLMFGHHMVVELPNGQLNLGRKHTEKPEQSVGAMHLEGSVLSIRDAQVSRDHGMFSYDGKTLTYTDNDSKNGTYFGTGTRLMRGIAYPLEPGVAIYLGGALRFKLETE